MVMLCEDDEFAHDTEQGHLGGFAGGAEPLAKHFAMRVAIGRHWCGHVKGALRISLAILMVPGLATGGSSLDSLCHFPWDDRNAALLARQIPGKTPCGHSRCDDGQIVIGRRKQLDAAAHWSGRDRHDFNWLSARGCLSGTSARKTILSKPRFKIDHPCSSAKAKASPAGGD